MIEIEIGEGQKQVLKQHKKSIDLFYILGQGKSLLDTTKSYCKSSKMYNFETLVMHTLVKIGRCPKIYMIFQT